MPKHEVTTKQAWMEARRALMAREKELTRLRDEVAAARRALPWVRVDKEYTFEGPNGPATLGDLFAGRSQLFVYHFMFGPDWKVGCKSCSFWADHFDPMRAHLAARDASLAVISRAQRSKVAAFAERMGWDFDWYSSAGNDFNFDFRVSFTPDQVERGDKLYNFATLKAGNDELPGISVFTRDDEGAVFRTYSTYARGLEDINTTYRVLDLLPKGRDEDALAYGMEWVRLHDEYEA
jgi:predicted dithiol-disulfide oxidoreductase (DUF899 family)